MHKGGHFHLINQGHLGIIFSVQQASKDYQNPQNKQYADKFCVEPHRNIENIARNTVCHIFLCGLYLAPLKLSENPNFQHSFEGLFKLWKLTRSSNYDFNPPVSTFSVKTQKNKISSVRNIKETT